MNRRLPLTVIALAALAAIAALGAACAQQSAKAASIPPTKWVINMSAVEYKGSTEVAKEPFPSQAEPPGGGYILKAPVDGKWETSAYRWAPESFTVFQGDDVELKIFGINGADHPANIKGYVDSFNVKRGQLTTVNFKADKVGVFKIVCTVHTPSMEGYLTVLPRP
ncbi:MAG: hypothetical protein HW403_824 [Dehalococcoidia bacterium]|nr:hypothetical protein [Dehalococcoidia bacterium]